MPASSRTPRGQQVLAQLRTMVLTGELAPGEVLIEARLSEHFSTSKTPVREALHVLAAEDLVTVLPKKGYLVRSMTPQDLSEVMDLRMLLEPHAAGEAALRADGAAVDRLRALLDAQRDSSPRDPLEGMRQAAAFHRMLTGLGRNTRVCAALERCYDETSRAHHLIPGLSAHMGQDVEVREHAAILTAIESGDAPGAREAMRTHLRTIREVTLAGWRDDASLWD